VFAAAGLSGCSFPIVAPTPFHPPVPEAAIDPTASPFLPLPATGPGWEGLVLPSTQTIPSTARAETPTAAPSTSTALVTSPTVTQTGAVTVLAPAQPSPTATTDSDGGRTVLLPLAEDILNRVNEDRVRLGLPALVSPRGLMQAAFERAESMVAGGYFDHTDPIGGGTPAQMILVEAGYGGGLAETLYATMTQARAIASEAVSAWMASAENRAILLSGAYRYAGVGLAGDGTWWTITLLLAEIGP